MSADPTVVATELTRLAAAHHLPVTVADPEPATPQTRRDTRAALRTELGRLIANAEALPTAPVNTTAAASLAATLDVADITAAFNSHRDQCRDQGRARVLAAFLDAGLLPTTVHTLAGLDDNGDQAVVLDRVLAAGADLTTLLLFLRTYPAADILDLYRRYGNHTDDTQAALIADWIGYGRADLAAARLGHPTHPPVLTEEQALRLLAAHPATPGGHVGHLVLALHCGPLTAAVIDAAYTVHGGAGYVLAATGFDPRRDGDRLLAAATTWPNTLAEVPAGAATWALTTHRFDDPLAVAYAVDEHELHTGWLTGALTANPPTTDALDLLTDQYLLEGPQVLTVAAHHPQVAAAPWWPHLVATAPGIAAAVRERLADRTLPDPVAAATIAAVHTVFTDATDGDAQATARLWRILVEGNPGDDLFRTLSGLNDTVVDQLTELGIRTGADR